MKFEYFEVIFGDFSKKSEFLEVIFDNLSQAKLRSSR